MRDALKTTHIERRHRCRPGRQQRLAQSRSKAQLAQNHVGPGSTSWVPGSPLQLAVSCRVKLPGIWEERCTVACNAASIAAPDTCSKAPATCMCSKVMSQHKTPCIAFTIQESSNFRTTRHEINRPNQPRRTSPSGKRIGVHFVRNRSVRFNRGNRDSRKNGRTGQNLPGNQAAQVGDGDGRDGEMTGKRA